MVRGPAVILRRERSEPRRTAGHLTMTGADFRFVPVADVPAWRAVPLVPKAGVRELRGLKPPFVNHYRLTITGH
jgi:hypothetical protein